MIVTITDHAVFFMSPTCLYDMPPYPVSQDKKAWRFYASFLYIIYMSIVAVSKLSGNPGKFLDQDQYRFLLETGLKIFIGGDPKLFLKSLFPKGAVGIKTNCLASFNPTFKPLADALTELLIKVAGIEENDIIIWERSNRELKNAGYKLNASSFGRRCLGTDTSGVGYSRDFYNSGKVGSLVTRILTRMVDHSINLPVLKDHSVAGLSAGMKNMFGAVNNPNKYHGNNCDPYAADINNLAPIKDKHRLTITDAARVQYDNGPGFDSRSLDYYNGLIISNDPVAADRVALQILEHLRAKNGRPPLAKVGRPVKYLDSAQKIGLGEADINRIDLRVVKVNEKGRERGVSRELF